MTRTRQHLAYVTVVVRDYDEAKAFWVGILGFEEIEDTPLEDGKRWVLVAPPGSRETRLLLARAVDDHQSSRIGDQTGGRVFLFLNTNDFWTDYERFRSKGVVFTKAPWEADYGTVAVFEDLDGNRCDLIQLKDHK